MATISLQALANVNSTKSNAQVFSDLHLDLAIGTTYSNQLYKTQQIQDVQADYNLAAISNSIASIISTNPGQKPLNPVFGVGLGNILFQPITNDRAESIGNAIYSAINAYEPRVNIVNVTVYPDVDNNSYTVGLNIIVPRFGAQQVTIVGTLDKSGFFINT